MAKINYENLIKASASLPVSESRDLMRQTFADKDVRKNFDFGRCFEACFGYAEFSACRSDDSRMVNKVFEAAGATSTAAFMNISGQIFYSTIMEAYKSEEFVFTNLIPSISTKLNGEKIPGITMPGDEGGEVGEGEPYPIMGVSEDYIETPQTTKRGVILPVTREAIFFDRTGVLMDRVQQQGFVLGLKQEKEAVDAVIDENRTVHRYKWRGTTYATYQTSTPWINSKTSNALVDWTSINEVEQLLNNMVDPNTGEPILFEPKHLIVAKQNVHTARRILSATNNRTGAYPTTGATNNLMDAPNTVDNYQIVTSRYVAARLATDTNWFLGDISRAVKYMENWPMEVTQAPAGNDDEFNRDIVLKFKANRRGEYVVVEPRVMCKSAA